jgi:hypothetical protein
MQTNIDTAKMTSPLVVGAALSGRILSGSSINLIPQSHDFNVVFPYIPLVKGTIVQSQQDLETVP